MLLPAPSPSYGNTTTGAACIDSHRSFKKSMKALTISLRNSSSLVKRSNVKNARTYLKGKTRRTAEDARRTSATCVVTCHMTSKYLGKDINISIISQLVTNVPTNRIHFILPQVGQLKRLCGFSAERHSGSGDNFPLMPLPL